jgi:hypothetical protein
MRCLWSAFSLRLILCPEGTPGGARNRGRGRLRLKNENDESSYEFQESCFSLACFSVPRNRSPIVLELVLVLEYLRLERNYQRSTDLTPLQGAVRSSPLNPRQADSRTRPSWAISNDSIATSLVFPFRAGPSHLLGQPCRKFHRRTACLASLSRTIEPLVRACDVLP